MKLWIRVDAAMPRDPAIAALADELGVELATMIGHVVTLWGVMAEHVANGDLSAVTDATLERWAGWTKRRAKFAPAFRAQFCDDSGVLRGWAERQGALLDRKERDRKRWSSRKSAETPPPLRTDSAETPAPLRVDSASTVRNGTERRSKAKANGVRPASAGSASAAFPVAECRALHTAWLTHIGAVDYPFFRKALAPLYPVGAPLYAQSEMAVAIQAFGEVRDAQDVDKQQFWHPKKFASEVHNWVRLGKMPTTDENGITERGRLVVGVT